MNDPHPQHRHPQQVWLDTIGRELDRSIEKLDDTTLARLRAIRRQAMASRTSPRRPARSWLYGGAVAAATAGTLAFALWLPHRQAVSPPTPEDLELLSIAEELEFYEDLEFYQWLELMHDQSG